MDQPIPKETKLAYLKKIEAGEMTAAQAAREIGVTKSSVYEWRKLSAEKGNGAMPGKGYQAPEDAELRKLREKVKQQEAEIAFLKKAARYFAAE